MTDDCGLPKSAVTIFNTQEAKLRKRQSAEAIVTEMIKKSVTVEEIIVVIDELHGNSKGEL